jgi:hypothetical protein
MDVHIDQAGQYGFAAEVDMFDVTAPFDGACVGNARNAAIGANENGGMVHGLAGQNVDHFVCGDDRILRGCRDRNGRQRNCENASISQKVEAMSHGRFSRKTVEMHA